MNQSAGFLKRVRLPQRRLDEAGELESLMPVRSNEASSAEAEMTRGLGIDRKQLAVLRRNLEDLVEQSLGDHPLGVIGENDRVHSADEPVEQAGGFRKRIDRVGHTRGFPVDPAQLLRADDHARFHDG